MTRTSSPDISGVEHIVLESQISQAVNIEMNNKYLMRCIRPEGPASVQTDRIVMGKYRGINAHSTQEKFHVEKWLKFCCFSA